MWTSQSTSSLLRGALSRYATLNPPTHLGGFSMTLSSRSSHRFSSRWSDFEEPVVAKQSPEDVDASAG